MIRKFISNKLPGFYLSFAGLLCAFVSLISYVVRGGNYLSPVSSAAVTLLSVGLVANLLCLVFDFKFLGVLPVFLYAAALAVLLNTERLFISNVAFGVDGNSFDSAFFLFWICAILARVLTAVGFSMGLSKNGKLVSDNK